MKPIIIIASIILLLVLGKFFIWDKDASAEATPAGPGGGKGGPARALPVLTTVINVDQSESFVYSSGTLAPNEEVVLRSETSGRLIKLNINEGAYVQKGQLIAKIKDDDIRAQLKKVSIEQELAKNTEARQKKLLDINAISKEEYEISANKVSTLNADKELLEVQLARTEVRAPFSGKIGLKNISEGAYISPSTDIATLVQTNPIKIDFTVPERYLDKIRTGQNIEFEIDGKNGKQYARVIAIDPKVDENLRTLKVRAQSPNAGGGLFPGMFVKVNLNLGSKSSIMIPSETIVPVLEGKKVFVKSGGKAVERMITTGLRNEKYVQVLSGLNVGDSLIISSLMTLKNDSPVISK